MIGLAIWAWVVVMAVQTILTKVSIICKII